MRKHKYVLDANSLIKFKDLLFTNYDCYITEGVIKEIKDEYSRKKLNTIMPLLKIAEPEEKDVNFIKHFAKLTGDYDSLSEVDIDLIALTYMLHRLYGDVSKLNASPMDTIYKYEDVEFDYVGSRRGRRTNSGHRIRGQGGAAVQVQELVEADELVGEADELIGEVDESVGEADELVGEADELVGEADELVGEADELVEADILIGEADGEAPKKNIREKKKTKTNMGIDFPEKKNICIEQTELEEENFKREDCVEGDKPEEEEKCAQTEYLGEGSTEEECNGEVEKRKKLTMRNGSRPRIYGCESIREEVLQVMERSEKDDDEESVNEWININNYDTQNVEINKGEKFSSDIACITTDYTMQNVLYQIGLNVITIDGYKINSLKLWGYICTSCYTFIKKNSLLFCSKCGNNNLRKVNVLVDNNLKKLIVKIPQFRVNNKNTIFSIPKKKNQPKKKFQDKLQIFREDELLIGGRKQYLKHQKKLYESQKSKKNPFSADNLYDYNNNDWTYRTTLKNGKVAILTNPKIIVGGKKKNIHRKKRK
ncbi:RNA-binding protein NOB1 [Plasmodium gonderi]|uniref:RNA-binding protein NOB1 n=1 Tax=Plasmodium gonderi TaxID=77519 RepID=A0A1Y1JB98_PLAGO|nr:RNA-binding protein NOB1 [Plasmodium gonderi]GAW79811.1 RNA-binding protein NOB1 [Plasmodium gonderi]